MSEVWISIYLVSSKDLEGVHNLVSSITIHGLACHESHKSVKCNIPSSIGINVLPQLIKEGIVGLEGKTINSKTMHL